MYDSLAAYYHLMFEDWDASIARQAAALGPLLENGPRILDAACGIGTQAIGLALRGHAVTGSDLSRPAIERARVETAARGLSIPLYVADMRDLSAVPGGPYDAVLIADNAVAHLPSSDDLGRTAESAAAQLRAGGILLATVRDYDTLGQTRPVAQGPAFFSDNGRRRIVHQVWDWLDEHRYTMHLYITQETNDGWECHHFTDTFHAVSRAAMSEGLRSAGFTDITWHEPSQTGYYQPIVLSRIPASTH